MIGRAIMRYTQTTFREKQRSRWTSANRKLAQEKEEREAALEARVMAVEVPEEALNKIAAKTEMHGRRGFVEACADFMTTPEMRKHIDCNDSQLQIGSELSHFFTKNTSHDGITNHLDIIRDVLRQWLPRDAAETRTEVLEENANLKKALEAFIERAEKANVAEKTHNRKFSHQSLQKHARFSYQIKCRRRKREPRRFIEGRFQVSVH